MDERVYKHTDIVSITRNEILFNDGHLINLVECSARWSEAKGITSRNYTCVGDRNMADEVPYFLLYSKPLTKVRFVKRGLFGAKKQLKQFEEMKSQIGSVGWTLRDISRR